MGDVLIGGSLLVENVGKVSVARSDQGLEPRLANSAAGGVCSHSEVSDTVRARRHKGRHCDSFQRGSGHVSKRCSSRRERALGRGTISSGHFAARTRDVGTTRVTRSSNGL
jgi:hypothetical protein